MRNVLRLFVSLIAAISPAAALADYQVNIGTTGDQGFSAVVMKPDGEFLVVWNHRSETLFGRFFADDGTPTTGELVVDPFQAGRVMGFASVAPRPNGDFVVVWRNGAYMVEKEPFWSVRLRHFDSALAPLGNFQTISDFFPTSARVTTSPAGEFVVMASSFYQPEQSSQIYGGIGGRLWDAADTVVASFSPEPTPPDATELPTQPSAAFGPDSGFVVVWISPDAGDRRTRFRRYDAAGLPLGDAEPAFSHPGSDHGCPSTAVGPDSFLVTWTGDGSPGNDTSDWSIQGRRFTNDGVALGPQFQINEATTGYQFCSSIVAEPDGNFLVVWSSHSSLGTDTAGSSIQARRVFASGQLGPELQVNTYTTGSQSGAGISSDGNGTFVIAWGSIGSPGTDTQAYSRSVITSGPLRFDQLLHDGFESGDTTRWFRTHPAPGRLAPQPRSPLK